MSGRGLPRLLLVFLALGCVVVHSACREDVKPAPTEASTRPVDPGLLAFLSRARAAHHRADLQEAQHPDRAVAALEEVIDGPLPARGLDLPEVREVLADTHARLADLLSRGERYELASRHVDRGLKLVREVSYFRGHLLEMRGHVAERLAATKTREDDQLLAAVDDKADEALAAARTRVDMLARQLQDRPDPAVAQQLGTARQSLNDIRVSLLSAEQQAAHRALLAERDAATQRALQAFEQAMDVQARVIELRTGTTSRPAD